MHLYRYHIPLPGNSHIPPNGKFGTSSSLKYAENQGEMLISWRVPFFFMDSFFFWCYYSDRFINPIPGWGVETKHESWIMNPFIQDSGSLSPGTSTFICPSCCSCWGTRRACPAAVRVSICCDTPSLEPSWNENSSGRTKSEQMLTKNKAVGGYVVGLTQFPS